MNHIQDGKELAEQRAKNSYTAFGDGGTKLWVKLIFESDLVSLASRKG